MPPHTAASIALCLAVGFVLSVPSAASDQPPSGESVLKQRCSTCHPPSKPIMKLREMPEPERAAYLEKLLARHFPPSPEERKALSEYLLQAAGAEAPR